jgi:hypothetical protein
MTGGTFSTDAEIPAAGMLPAEPGNGPEKKNNGSDGKTGGGAGVSAATGALASQGFLPAVSGAILSPAPAAAAGEAPEFFGAEFFSSGAAATGPSGRVSAGSLAGGFLSGRGEFFPEFFGAAGASAAFIARSKSLSAADRREK